MNKNIYTVNPAATSQAVKNTLTERIAQTKAIVSCIMLASNELHGALLYDVIWAVDNNLEQIEQLQAFLERQE